MSITVIILDVKIAAILYMVPLEIETDSKLRNWWANTWFALKIIKFHIRVKWENWEH